MYSALKYCSHGNFSFTSTGLPFCKIIYQCWSVNLKVRPIRQNFCPKDIRSFYKSTALLKGLDPNWGSMKHKDKRKMQYQILRESFKIEEIEKQLEPLRVCVKEQGDIVRNLKASGAPETEVKNEVKILKARRKDLNDMSLKLLPTDTFNRARMADLAKRRFFYDTSFAIYGGVGGQYDYGPLGCEIVDNILAEWHRHFVIHERMLKVNCTSLTPEKVLKASGHVNRFMDYAVKDTKTGECFRLDHLIKQHFEAILCDGKATPEEERSIREKMATLDAMSMADMTKLLKEYNIKSPSAGSDLSNPIELNLMFPVSIGHTGNLKAFLRPETAQGIFTNFKKLLDCKQGKLPFACAQVGNAFRNETNPKSGLLRVREFMMAEIEHFCYPDDKDHPKFKQVGDTKVWLYSACSQMDGESPKLVTIGEAVENGVVANETLGYYMARIQQFLLKIGIHPLKLRFRQHFNTEMAHYAQDCWDAECLTSHGWTECVGCADRSAYDLTQHAKATGVDLSVERDLAAPREEERLHPVVQKRRVKAAFKDRAGAVLEELRDMDQDRLRDMDHALRQHGEYALLGDLKVDREMVPEVQSRLKKVTSEKIIPSVVEPSFGVGRIFYALLEHTFSVREDDSNRTFFALPPLVSPVKVAILPLINKPEFMLLAQQIADDVSAADLSVWIDDRATMIGRRYVRMDEMSVPFCVTVDQASLDSAPRTVTLRERDSTKQVRLTVDQVPATIKLLSQDRLSWDQVVAKWPKVSSHATPE